MFKISGQRTTYYGQNYGWNTAETTAENTAETNLNCYYLNFNFRSLKCNLILDQTRPKLAFLLRSNLDLNNVLNKWQQKALITTVIITNFGEQKFDLIRPQI